MTGDVVAKALAAACGETREGAEADVVGGIVPAFVVAPGSTDEAAAVLRAAAEHELAVVARGAGGRLGWGVPPSRCDLMIDMSRMSSVVEHSAGDLVARVQAGARMGDVAAALARDGQEIALDVPDQATVGGVVASGLAGPRRLRYGTPRDLLIGITIVRADGTVARSGGKVVKNVAGYDLGKLLAGSAGTLALITDATFRLHPLPAARAYVTAEYVVRPDRVRRGGGGGELAAGRLRGGAEPAGAGRADPDRRAPRGVGGRGRGPRHADGGSARPGRDVARAAALVARRARRPTAGTLIRVSCWVSALPTVLDAVDAAAARRGRVAGDRRLGRRGRALPAGRSPTWTRDRSAGLVRGAAGARCSGERGGVVVLAAPAAVREALAGRRRDGGERSLARP